MNKLKRTRFFSLGRKWIFTLALFLLVFAAASVVKIHAAGNVTGWLWGGGAESDGAKPWDTTQTSNVRWISTNKTNCDSDNNGLTDTGNYVGCPSGIPVVDYGVSIPPANGDVKGYAWSGGDNAGPGLGWIDFDPQNGHCVEAPTAPGPSQYQAFSCVPPVGCGGAGVSRNVDDLNGCARIVEIAKASAVGNSGGWSGWLKVSGSTYGVKITSMDGIAKDPSFATSGTAGEDELGWIDFSGAKYTPTPPPPRCVTGRSTCDGTPIGTCNKDTDCMDSTSCAVTDATHWTCSNGTEVSESCPTIVNMPENGQCGTADGSSFCQGQAPTDAEMCIGGTHPDPSSLNLDSYEVKWTCSGVCSSVNEDCSAKGKKTCGWIETNP